MTAGAPVRVAMLLQDLAYGGTQRQALELARRLDRSRFAPEIWTLMAGEDLLPLAREYALPVRRFSPLPFVGPDALARLGLALMRERIDLLFLLTAVPNIWGRVLGRTLRRLMGRRAGGRPAILASCRGGGAPWRQHERRLWPLADAHVSNTHAVKDVLVREHGLPPDRVAVIPNGVDVVRFQPAAPSRPAAQDEPEFLQLARLVEDKDHDTCLHAFARLLETVPGARLRLAGDGPRLPRLLTLADRLFSPIQRRQVIFEPARLDVLPLLQAADVLALTSIREAMPNVILEAMACGLPVLASRVGGIPELVLPGETGLLAPPGDIPAFAKAMTRLAADPALRQRLGQAGRRRVAEEFSFEAMTRRHEALFHSLLSGH